MADIPQALKEAPPRDNRAGCGLVGLFVFAIVWVLGSTILVQVVTWVTEQTLMEGSIGLPDVRWVIALGYAIMVLIPVAISTASVSLPRPKAIYRTWTMAAIFALFVVPARVIFFTQSQLAAVLQIMGMALYLMLLWRWLKPEKGGALRLIWLALIAGGLITLPWALWGALGSPMDILLGLVVALMFGVCAALTIQSGMLKVTQQDPTADQMQNVLMEGLAASLTLAIMATGLGLCGAQLMLVFALPVLGWAVSTLTAAGSWQTRGQNWLTVSLLLALAAAGPLLWVDPDELALVITGTPGDLISFAAGATLGGLLMGLLLSIIGVSSYKRLRQAAVLPAKVKIGAGLAWALVLIVYFLAGQPGFHGERLFVILNDQADLSPAAQIADPAARRAWVYETLTAHANTTQGDIRKTLDTFNFAYQPYYLVNAIEVQGGPIIRWWLENRPEVDRVLDSPRLRPLPADLPTASGSATPSSGPDWNLTMIHADQVWDQLGVRGDGIIIGQSDSGVQGDHPELNDSYLGRDGQNDYRWYDPWFGSTSPTDIGGHGTHTLGSILGNQVGVAPDADWIGCVNLGRNLGNPALYLDCWQFMLAPFPQTGDPLTDGDPARGANILNNSWGCPEIEGCDPSTFISATKALRSAGIFVVVSAGNSGYGGCGSVKDPPATDEFVYSVGAIDSNGSLAEFSSIGPVVVDGSERTKPDIVAPGDGVLSSYPGSSYEVASGTSMAGPHVVGVVALMWSANPALIGEVEETIAILNETAQPYEGPYPECVTDRSAPNNAVGYGIVDAYAAVLRALQVHP